MHAGRECVRVLTTAAALVALAVPASAFAPVAAGPRLACKKHASTLAFYAVSVRFPPSLPPSLPPPSVAFSLTLSVCTSLSRALSGSPTFSLARSLARCARPGHAWPRARPAPPLSPRRSAEGGRQSQRRAALGLRDSRVSSAPPPQDMAATVAAASSFGLAAYLRRIGLELAAHAQAPSLATLTAVMAAQSRAIPFENLDVVLHKKIAISPSAVEEKLVGSGRGGYCFEQNQLLASALQCLGFNVSPMLCRVRWNKAPDEQTTFTHVALAVKVGGNGSADGGMPRTYLADVGFAGTNSIAPVRVCVRVRVRVRVRMRVRVRGVRAGVCQPACSSSGVCLRVCVCACVRASLRTRVRVRLAVSVRPRVHVHTHICACTPHADVGPPGRPPAHARARMHTRICAGAIRNFRAAADARGLVSHHERW